MTEKVLEIIGENFNTTRRVKATSPRIVLEDGKAALVYKNLDGVKCFLDVSALYPQDPAELKKTQITHVAQAMKNKDLDYIGWIIRAQVEVGATIIDICVDEISVDPDERNEWMQWIIPVAQDITDLTLAVDSSDPRTIIDADIDNGGAEFNLGADDPVDVRKVLVSHRLGDMGNLGFL